MFCIKQKNVIDYHELFSLAVICPLLAYVMLQLSAVLLPLSSTVFTTLSTRLVFRNTKTSSGQCFCTFHVSLRTNSDYIPKQNYLIVFIMETQCVHREV